MIVLVIARNRDLHTRPEGKANAVVNVNPANHQTWVHECLFFAIVFTALPERGVRFHFGSEIVEHMVLRSRVPSDGMSDITLIRYRQPATQGALHIEMPPALACSHIRRNYRRLTSILVHPGWDAASQKKSKYIVAVLFVFGNKAIFSQKRDVAQSVN